MELCIGTTILAARHTKGLTQEALADLVGVSAAAVSKWETGASYPDITLLPPIARALGMTVDALPRALQRRTARYWRPFAHCI
nr:helix-turn-helix transcriptional regulator [uncultured Agathobaculum sp.]